jgi:AcrR family transcriptional regulator
LAEVIGGASRVFAENGFLRTQMADIAREAALSPAALYQYAENKEALFYWCIEVAVDPSVLAGASLPLPGMDAAVMVERVRQHLDDVPRQKRILSRALRNNRPGDTAEELRSVIAELYDAIARNRRLMAMIERSAQEMPELFEAFYTQMRKPAIDDLTTYLQRRMDHHYLRSLVDVPTTARLVLETTTWFARYRHQDPDSLNYDDVIARETVLDVLVHALLPVEDRRS